MRLREVGAELFPSPLQGRGYGGLVRGAELAEVGEGEGGLSPLQDTLTDFGGKLLYPLP